MCSWANSWEKGNAATNAKPHTMPNRLTKFILAPVAKTAECKSHCPRFETSWTGMVVLAQISRQCWIWAVSRSEPPLKLTAYTRMFGNVEPRGRAIAAAPIRDGLLARLGWEQTVDRIISGYRESDRAARARRL